VEIEKMQEEKTLNIDNNEALKLIIEEIKSIKEQLKDLKSNKTVIPEVEEDTEHNEKIRKASEEYIFEVLKRKYPDRVKWLNENGESYSDHDFEILDIENGTIEYYIECKGTVKNKPTFYMTKNEWRLFLNHTKNYQIYFVKNSFGNPSHIFIDNLLDWLLKGKIVPYLKERDIIKEERVFLTLNETTFSN
jgi:DNA gyrase/topoisomerase IV subunit A